MLRSEQDREYQEMVETDRRMQEEKQMVSLPHIYNMCMCIYIILVMFQERERAEREEEEAVQQKELEDALALSVQLAKEDQIAAAKKRLGERGPPAKEAAALIRFQLPHGVKISSTFHRDDKIAVSTPYRVCCA